MGSLVYDFLHDSFLFDENHLNGEFHSVKDSELTKELSRYRDYCILHIDDLKADVDIVNSSLKLFSGLDIIPTNTIKQAALYLEQIIMQDPLFPLTYKPGQMGEVMSRFYGFNGSELNRNKLVNVLKQLKSITPMIAADYVKLLPISYYFEPPAITPIHMSENYFSDLLPKELLAWFHSQAHVSSLKNSGKGWFSDGSLEIGRSIIIDFLKHNMLGGYIYHLHEQTIEPVPGSDTKFRVRIEPIDASPAPSREYFDVWVFQSINKSARDIYDQVVLKNVIAHTHNAQYLCESEFVFDLLQQEFKTKESIKSHTINTLLNFQLPTLDKVNIETMMRVRQNESDAFQRFRTELDRQLRDLRTITDPVERQIKTENAYNEITESKISDIESAFKSISKTALAEAGIITGGLIGAVQSGGWSLAASAVAVAAGYKTWREYSSKVRSNPSFFYWKILKESERDTV